jgi:hypothetical protein
MSVLNDSPLLQRTLAAVYVFYDAFFPLDDHTRPLTSPLKVSIPELHWDAFFGAGDSTYRFSALTLTQPPPSGLRKVQVTAVNGDYSSLVDIAVTLPLPIPPNTPPTRADYLIPTPLWPTVALRPPDGETAVRGSIFTSTAQSVAGLKVEMWLGPAVTPPVGTPFTLTNANGDFLFRFPLLKKPLAPATTIDMRLRLHGGALTVSPSSLPVLYGQTQILSFQLM